MKLKPSRIKIAYAEDHVAVREAMVGLLEKDNQIQVICQKSNGKELLEQLIIADEMPDLCLIDINMPIMNGFALLREIRKRWPQLSCLILTSFVEEAYIINMVKSGANGYLLKSCSSSELVAAIKLTHKNGHYFNEIMNEQVINDIILENKKSPILNEREILLLEYVCSDLSYSEIAIILGTTYKTVDGIRERLCAKLHINSRIGLVLAAIKLGYYTIENQQFSKVSETVKINKFKNWSK